MTVAAVVVPKKVLPSNRFIGKKEVKREYYELIYSKCLATLKSVNVRQNHNIPMFTEIRWKITTILLSANSNPISTTFIVKSS